MKKIIIITYYWPPAGGVSVQRWLKFVKYLPDHGWQPVIFTADHGDYPIEDKKLSSQIPEGVEVVKVPFFDPRSVVKLLLPKEKSNSDKKKDNLDRLFYIPAEERTWQQRCMLWIRSNLFIPDARKYWIEPCTKAILNYLDKNKVGVIVSNGPPNSAHLIGLNVKNKTGIKWMADFRDPWTFAEYFDLLPLSRNSRIKHLDLEKQVLQKSDLVSIVSESWKEEYALKQPKRIEVLHNGFDEEDFVGVKKNRETENFVIGHVGTLQNDRNPKGLWEALQSLLEKEKPPFGSFKVKLVGVVDEAVVESIKEVGLEEVLDQVGVVSHKEAIQHMMDTDLLLLIINESRANEKGRLTAKIYEYLATGNPILMIGPKDSDAGRLLASFKHCLIMDKNISVTELSENLILFLEKIKQKTNSELDINKYSRKSLTAQLNILLESLV